MRPQKLSLDRRGRILLPFALRDAAGLQAGQPLAVALGEVSLVVFPSAEVVDRRPSTLDRKGRLTLPAPLRGTLGLIPGMTVLAKATPEGLLLETPARLMGRMRAARLALQRRLEEAGPG